MNRNTYHRDLKKEAAAALGTTFDSKKLGPVIMNEDAIEFGNEFCRIQLKSSDDFFYISFRFFDPRADRIGIFQLDSFLFATAGPNNYPKEPAVLSDEGDFDRYLAYYRKILETFFDLPLLGDYTWADRYDDWNRQGEKVELFFSSLPWGDPRKRAILQKQVKGDDTWVEDGKRLYQEIHGKEME